MKEEVLKRYIKGESTESERRSVIDWIEENEENAKIFNSMKADWIFTHLPNRETSDCVVKKIKKRIRPSISLFDSLVKIAAVLLIPIIAYSVCQYFSFRDRIENMQEPSNTIASTIPVQNRSTIDYTVNSGVKGIVELPDGSKVWLNSKSHLKAPSEFDSIFRMVELNGEGYFIVVSNKKWPMYVKTSKDITVKVTGTEFNLSSYENDSELKITLVSGNVTLIKERTKQVYAVNTMEELVIPDDVKVKSHRGTADIHINTSWKDGDLVFENTPMSEVIKKIERWYGVNITINNPDILTYFFTANFNSESITQVLELLKITSNIRYSINKNNVRLYL